MVDTDQSAASPRLAVADPADPQAQCGADGLTSLTGKQRDVLDLLIQHKTSKEISRTLGISPHTVDQRIMLARAKLGVSSRGEMAQAYRRLLGEDRAILASELSGAEDLALSEDLASAAIYERSIYGFSAVAPADDAMQGPDRDDLAERQTPLPPRREALPRAALHGGDALAEPYHHVLPEMFDGTYGTVIRLGTIAVFAMFLILIVMGGLAMFAQLSQIIEH